MKILWDKKRLRLLRKWYPILPSVEVAKKIGVTREQLKAGASRYKVVKKGKLHAWAYCEELKLIELYPDMTNVDIAIILNKTEGAVIAAGFKLKLRKTKEFLRKHTEKGMFKRGQEPPNKGKRWQDFMSKEGIENSSKTQFKKGNKPHNTKWDGATRISKDGYMEIRVSEANWKLLHRVEWEKKNGEIPKGMVLVCKSTDKQNTNPVNWELITMAENMRRNSYHNNYPKEIGDTIQLLGALNRQINKRV